MSTVSRGIFSLASAPCGTDLRIRRIRTGKPCHDQRLRELGLLEGRTVRVVSSGDPMICELGDSRFGLCRHLAQCVLVESAADCRALSA